MPLNWGVVVSGAMKMNYPKMLYKGNKVNYKYSTANDAEHEDELKDQGFVDYADLGDEPKLDQFADIGRIQTGGNIDPDVMSLKIENNKLLEQLSEHEAEIDRLNQIIDAGAIENAELRAQLEKNQPEMSSEVNYSDMTSDELRVLLDEKGIKYLARDSKDTLIKLLG